MIVETHIHICDPKYDNDRYEMLERAGNAGVKKFINIGAELPECRKVVETKEEGIYNAIGLHPHYIDSFDESVMEEFKRYFSEGRKLVAVGEIGLDFYKSTVSPEVQKKGFRRFMDLAAELELPVIIHSREAHEEVYSVLKEYNLKKKGIIHCFTGGVKTAEFFIGLGYVIGVGGVVTFPNAGPLRETVKEIPLEHMVLETDAPWLAPQAVRGGRNEAAYITYTAREIARLKQTAVETVEKTTTENAEALFGI
ncbi:MAG: TatD family hydrolase [Candidatus Goldiibacteriota bacterium]